MAAADIWCSVVYRYIMLALLCSTGKFFKEKVKLDEKRFILMLATIIMKEMSCKKEDELSLTWFLGFLHLKS